MNHKITDNKLKRRMMGERIMLAIPFNVVMTARIDGNIDLQDLTNVVNKLKKRHSLLGVRVIFDENNQAWYTNEGVQDFSIRVIDRVSDNQWEDLALEQTKISFEIEKGPLVRFLLLHSKEKSDLIICSHHIISDGLSITYLIRDILYHLNKSENEIEVLGETPLISRDTVPNPPKNNKLKNVIMGLINKKWETKNLNFSNNDIMRLHNRFWHSNKFASMLTWELSSSITNGIINRCKEEGVSVNTFLWNLFLAAQHDVLGNKRSYLNMAGMAVNIRDMLKTPAGETLGFFASSLSVPLKYSRKKSFWKQAKSFHKKIKKALSNFDPSKMLIVELMNPSLVDSLYFEKYGLISDKLSRKILEKMKWDSINYGYSITNVGKVKIPNDYGNLHLKSIYGPLFYSDVNERTVGVITVGDIMTFTMTYNSENIDFAKVNEIRSKFNYYIKLSLGVNQ